MTASAHSRTPARGLALDLRSPLVVDVRELGRRPGSMRPLRRTVEAPADWALELVRVPAGAEVDLDLRLESVMDGVLVSGVVTAPTGGECGRCLTAVSGTVTADVQELFAYEPAEGDDADDVLLVDGDHLDLRAVVRDAVVLALPLNPVCSPDCAGLCAGCGLPLASLPVDHVHDESDPRWSALAGLAAESASDFDPTTQTES